MNIKLFIFLMILLSACSSQDNRLEYALRFAESNRTELEKVLDHYSTDPEKLEAARFHIIMVMKVGNKTPLNKFWLMPLKENPFTEMIC